MFLADPGVVVLDEASRRLDPATEASITAATDRLLAGRTVVVIAHRLATLDRADQILVLDHGQVAEHGDRGHAGRRSGQPLRRPAPGRHHQAGPLATAAAQADPERVR